MKAEMDMTTHSCSYYCTNPPCIKAQRDEMRAEMEAMQDSHARICLEYMSQLGTCRKIIREHEAKLARVETACRDALEIIKDDGHTEADDQAIVVLERALRGEHE